MRVASDPSHVVTVGTTSSPHRKFRFNFLTKQKNNDPQLVYSESESVIVPQYYWPVLALVRGGGGGGGRGRGSRSRSSRSSRSSSSSSRVVVVVVHLFFVY